MCPGPSPQQHRQHSQIKNTTMHEQFLSSKEILDFAAAVPYCRGELDSPLTRKDGYAMIAVRSQRRYYREGAGPRGAMLCSAATGPWMAGRRYKQGK